MPANGSWCEAQEVYLRRKRRKVEKLLHVLGSTGELLDMEKQQLEGLSAKTRADVVGAARGLRDGGMRKY